MAFVLWCIPSCQKIRISGQLFVFRGRAGDRVKIIWWSGDGLCLFAKRLERGEFVWPQATHGHRRN